MKISISNSQHFQLQGTRCLKNCYMTRGWGGQIFGFSNVPQVTVQLFFFATRFYRDFGLLGTNVYLVTIHIVYNLTGFYWASGIIRGTLIPLFRPRQRQRQLTRTLKSLITLLNRQNSSMPFSQKSNRNKYCTFDLKTT